MRALPAFVAGLLSLAPAPAWAGPGACKAIAQGAEGERVEVTFDVGSDAVVTARRAVWNPPHAGVKPPTRPVLKENEQPALAIGYDPVSETVLGTPTSAIVIVAATSALPKLQGGRAALALGPVLDMAPLVGIGLTARNPKDPSFWLGAATFDVNLPGVETSRRDPVRAGPPLKNLLEEADVVTVIVMARDAESLGVSYLRLSGHASRDALFKAAWTEASRNADNPSPCLPQPPAR